MKNSTPVIHTSKHGESEIIYSNAFFSINGGLVINWGATNCGFGELYINRDDESGKLVFDSETMSRGFVTKVLEKLVQDSIFSDYEQPIKEVKIVSLEEANEIFGFKEHVLRISFFSGDDELNPQLIQKRWHIADDKVLNIWFDKTKLGDYLEKEHQFDLEIKFNQEKSFHFGFVKAEIWSWTIEEKN
jgi:hypothetical protein